METLLQDLLLRDPFGSRMAAGKDEWWTVVGVAAESKHRSLTEKTGPHLFVPVLQSYQPAMTLLVRTAGDPFAASSTVTAQIRGLDASLPILGVRTLAEHVKAASYPQRFGGTLLAAFGALALGLAVMGLYGVLAYTVGKRTREIGIRVALGGRARDIFSLVLSQALGVVIAGLLVGLLAALFSARALSKLLIDVSPFEPLTFLAVGAVLLSASLFACLIPARRATRTDPAIALRFE